MLEHEPKHEPEYPRQPPSPCKRKKCYSVKNEAQLAELGDGVIGEPRLTRHGSGYLREIRERHLKLKAISKREAKRGKKLRSPPCERLNEEPLTPLVKSTDTSGDPTVATDRFFRRLERTMELKPEAPSR